MGYVFVISFSILFGLMLHLSLSDKLIVNSKVTSRASDMGVACENDMYLKTPSKTCYKQVETGARSKTFVNRTAMAKPKRQQGKKCTWVSIMKG
jgi:hypothetical protein